MKKYAVTTFGDEYAVHEHIGGGAYMAIFFGTHNEVVKFLNKKGIMEYFIGE